MASLYQRYIKVLIIVAFLQGIASQSQPQDDDASFTDTTELEGDDVMTDLYDLEEESRFIPSDDHHESLEESTILGNSSNNTERITTSTESIPTTSNNTSFSTESIPTISESTTTSTESITTSKSTSTSSESYVPTTITSSTRTKSNSTTVPSETTTTTTTTTTKADPPAACPAIGAKQVARSVVKCHCKGDEILKEDGSCEYYNGTLIPIQYDRIYTREIETQNKTLIIRNVTCDPDKYTYREFTKGQFHIRERGDVVLLKDARELAGQRINNYCLTHHLDNESKLTWTMKTCIPIPLVPRCCPYGYAMKDGVCKEAKTPEKLTPPIAALPFGKPLEWQNITNYYSPLTCKSKPVEKVAIGYKQSNLVSLADGVENGWVPGVTDKRRVYFKCPEYCVDGIQKSDGSTEYFTSFCYRDPQAQEEACAKGPCIRKCCDYGQSMDNNRHRCVPDVNASFQPPVPTNLSHYNIVFGWPLCTQLSKTKEKIGIDQKGNLILKDREFSPADFCVDTFLDNEKREQSALACLTETFTWFVVRPILFPICNIISLTFLTMNIICHLLVPKLMNNGGVHQLCHALSLAIAYATSFILHVFHNFFSNTFCVNIAIVMQFGFLTTFFWLNVMCFEIWRKIRRLKNLRECKSYPNKYYMLFGWGIPFSICMITVMMQHLAPDNVWGLIKPYIGVSRCWFREELALFLYFYGPIAFLFICNTLFLTLTYFNYKMMMAKYLGARNDLEEIGTKNHNSARNASSSMPARRITDHVQEFIQKLKLFVLMATCWVTEILSWQIPPIELWALTDTLNSLQGLFIFIILLSNRNKRKQIEEKYPGIFKLVRKYIKIPAKLLNWVKGDGHFPSLSPVSSFSSSISKKFSSSVNTFTTSIRSRSSTSFDLETDPSGTQRKSSLDGCDINAVVGLSHAPLQNVKTHEIKSSSIC